MSVELKEAFILHYYTLDNHHFYLDKQTTNKIVFENYSEKLLKKGVLENKDILLIPKQ